MQGTGTVSIRHSKNKRPKQGRNHRSHTAIMRDEPPETVKARNRKRRERRRKSV